MRVRIDNDRCNGHMLCTMECPEVFEFDNEIGKSRVAVDSIPPEHGEHVRAAARACPEQAIEVSED
jgi:ferredoxin